MPEAVLHLSGTLEADWSIRAQVEEDLDEAVLDEDDFEDDDWDDLDEPEELEFDENGDDWDDGLGEDLEDFVADAGADDEW